MAIVFPVGVSAQGNTAVAFTTTMTSTTAPKIADITAVGSITLSCYLTDFNLTGSQNSGTDSRLCSKQLFEAPGFETYSVEDLVYITDPQGSSATDAEAIMVDGAVGWLVERLGIDATLTDWVVGQKVNVIPVTLGVRWPTKTSSDEFGKFALTQKVFVTAAPTFKKTTVA